MIALILIEHIPRVQLVFYSQKASSQYDGIDIK